MVLTASRDGSLKLWQQNTAVAEARGDFSDVRCVAVSPDSRWVVAGHGDGTVRLWEVAQPTQHVRFGLYNDLAFLKSGRQLIAQYHCFDVTDMHRPKQLDWGPAPVVSAIGGADGTLTVLRTNRLESWDTAAMRPLRSRPLDATVRCAAAHRAHAKGAHAKAASADGAKVKFAAGTDAGLILMIEEGEAPKNAAITTPLGSIHGVAWNDVGTQIAAVGEYGVALWDVASTAKPRWWIDSPWQPSGGVSIHGDQVATSSADGAIILRSSATGEPRRSLRGHAGRVTCLAFSADGQWLASAGTDDHVRVWDPAPNGALQDSALATFPVVHTPGWLCFDPSGRWLIGGGTQDSYAWDLRRHVLAALLRPGGDLCGQFSADGKTLLLGMHFGAVHACTVDELEQSARKAENTGAQRLDVKTTVLPARHMFAVWGVAASPDGKWLATAGHDERVHLWRSDSRELVASLTGRAGLVWTVAFSPDSRHVASGGPGIKIWDVEGRERFDLTGHQGLVVSLAYHPKRPWLFSSGNDGTVRLWDTSNGKELGILHRFTGAVNKLAVDPAGRWLAAACHDHHVALWDLSKQLTGDAPDIAAGQPPQRLLKGHANSVWAVGFSPDSRTLVSGSADGAVHLWETDGSTRLTTIHAPSPRVRTVAFTDDGRYLGIACFAGQGAIWDLDALRKSLQNMHLDW
jgi:WD40 repeat protein